MKLKLNLAFINERGENFIDIPDHSVILEPTIVSSNNPKRLIEESFAAPVSSENFYSFVASHNKLLIVVNDSTRFTPTSLVLEQIFQHVTKDRIYIVVATGAHRSPTETELKKILGQFYLGTRERVYIHDANNSGMRFYGITQRGTEVYINSIINKVDGIIVIGSTEPHYFAGYTGGRKGIVPGIASYRTIEQNHKLALLEDSQILRLSGNPVHEDLVEAVSFVLKEKDIFGINTVLDGYHTLYKVVSGDIFESHKVSVKFANDVFVKRIDNLFDIVIAVVPPPLDINLYQAHKGIENSKLSVRKGGIIILVASCWEGIGPQNFYNLLLMDKTPSELKTFVWNHYKLGYHKAVRLVETFEKADIYAVTTLERKILENIGIKPFYKLQDALNYATNKLEEDSHILVVLDAAVTVPVTSLNTK
ncbi:MAG: nickel-dependent lactate racemase [Candidatus Asgardarchaeia archaeon]